MYSPKVMEHFMNPKNVGEISDADGIGEVGNPVCGDMMTFYIKVENDRLKDVKFKTFGCGAAIAVSSMISEMAKGKTLDEAMEITNAMVADELGGLPSHKMHCSNLGADALHKAIENYRQRLSFSERVAPAVASAGKEIKPEACKCPFCSSPISSENLNCKLCGVNFRFCPECHKPIPEGATVCPFCKSDVSTVRGEKE